MDEVAAESDAEGGLDVPGDRREKEKEKKEERDIGKKSVGRRKKEREWLKKKEEKPKTHPTPRSTPAPTVISSAAGAAPAPHRR